MRRNTLNELLEMDLLEVLIQPSARCKAYDLDVTRVVVLNSHFNVELWKEIQVKTFLALHMIIKEETRPPYKICLLVQT